MAFNNGFPTPWSTDRYRIGFLTESDRPVGLLACPARFERATLALLLAYKPIVYVAITVVVDTA